MDNQINTTFAAVASDLLPARTANDLTMAIRTINQLFDSLTCEQQYEAQVPPASHNLIADHLNAMHALRFSGRIK